MKYIISRSILDFHLDLSKALHEQTNESMVNVVIFNVFFVLSHIDMADHRIDSHINSSRLKSDHTCLNGIYFLS